MPKPIRAAHLTVSDTLHLDDGTTIPVHTVTAGAGSSGRIEINGGDLPLLDALDWVTVTHADH